LDTGAFSEDRYFDVFVEYAKASPEHILILITVHYRGPESAILHLLPTFWFRNTWSGNENRSRPQLRQLQPLGQRSVLQASHSEIGERFILFEALPPLIFTENETNMERICNTYNTCPYVKDAFHNYVIHGRTDAVNPQKIGTKAAAYYQLTVPAGKCQTVRLELADVLSASPIGGLHPGPHNGLFHLAWKSAKPADFHFPTAPAATIIYLLSGRLENQKPKPDLGRD